MAIVLSQKIVSVLLATACMFLVYVPSKSLAQGVPPVIGYQQCLALISSAENCGQELYAALSSMCMAMQMRSDCCKVVKELNDNCWSLLFPFARNFSSYAKNTLCAFS